MKLYICYGDDIQVSEKIFDMWFVIIMEIVNAYSVNIDYKLGFTFSLEIFAEFYNLVACHCIDYIQLFAQFLRREM